MILSMGEGFSPGAPRDDPASPRAPPTGVNVAALRSPTRTRKAISGRRCSSSAPPGAPAGNQSFNKLELETNG